MHKAETSQLPRGVKEHAPRAAAVASNNGDGSGEKHGWFSGMLLNSNG